MKILYLILLKSKKTNNIVQQSEFLRKLEITDQREIDIIKQDFYFNNEKKNASADEIHYDKLKKDKVIFKEGKIYEINIELLEEVNEELWKNLI